MHNVTVYLQNKYGMCSTTMTAVVIPMFNNTITRYLACDLDAPGFNRNRHAATRNIQHSEFACIVSFFRSVSLSLRLFLSRSLLVHQLPLHLRGCRRRRQGRRLAPVRASLLAAIPGVYLRVPHFPFTTTANRTPDSITTATILHQNKLPPAARRALTTSQWFLVQPRSA